MLLIAPIRASASTGDECEDGTVPVVRDAITVCVLVPASGGGHDNTPNPDAPVCRWEPVPYGTVRASTIVDVTAQAGDGNTYYTLTNGGIGRTLADGTTQRGMRRRCEDGSLSALVWWDVTSLADIVNGTVIAATRRIPAPAVAISPPPEVGGVVNLGMWLAVSNADPISVRVDHGSVWAETTATIIQTVWDMGNGDVVTCDGPGVVLHEGDPGWNSAEQGPCGYTYTEIPPDEPYHVTVTATWSVEWNTSAGTSGARDPIVMTSGFDYAVVEIQTVGVSG